MNYLHTAALTVTTLDLPAGTTPAVLGFMLNGKVLAKTSLTAYYGRLSICPQHPTLRQNELPASGTA
ncbi:MULTISPECIES: hypothetical protein [Deinococcus]|uniref:hypothetical protein n=1 Tax=Deinococcus TaxID=1298 RepID=UPI000A7D309A|nr:MULTISPECIES: hypothetical protein [Deinococcus]MDK2013868.1 hypothetical protein [Deinococcus sp. 43]